MSSMENLTSSRLFHLSTSWMCRTRQCYTTPHWPARTFRTRACSRSPRPLISTTSWVFSAISTLTVSLLRTYHGKQWSTWLGISAMQADTIRRSHGDYDPNAGYAREAKSDDEKEAAPPPNPAGLQANGTICISRHKAAKRIANGMFCVPRYKAARRTERSLYHITRQP